MQQGPRSIRENKHKTIDHSGLSCWRVHEDVASNPSHAVPVRSTSEACSRLVKVWDPGMTAIRGRCSRGSCHGSAGWTLSLEPKPLELCRTWQQRCICQRYVSYQKPSQASGLLQVEAGCDATANRDTADLQKCRNFSVWNLDATFSLAHRGTPQKFVISTN
ncbi:hypothetical protein M438DRAFT_206303 [Aureobasidium pullulans EXF-150]|uniref:Uncharacterized protein n=1 Tax=Aureobasidium pullulans EXF-150 TaxID=1043002 RepID=A0A074XHT3_AURPU|nr:uncharacterized protein M438DRAFT_206303 [Aureobasidium pullulans EXF-150]KEQ85060.1 hypothetical protein M438DRAFT_206303 [Aureobasidium pullulans EXF-150]